MSVMRSGARGDLFVHVRIETPVNLSKEQKELLEKFSKFSAKKPNSPETEEFHTTVRNQWDDVKD